MCMAGGGNRTLQHVVEQVKQLDKWKPLFGGYTSPAAYKSIANFIPPWWYKELLWRRRKQFFFDIWPFCGLFQLIVITISSTLYFYV